MPKQSLLNLIKRWKRYDTATRSWQHIPPYTRGLYVLYTCVGKEHRVFYIGVAGIGATGGGGIRSRIKRHDLNLARVNGVTIHILKYTIMSVAQRFVSLSHCC